MRALPFAIFLILGSLADAEVDADAGVTLPVDAGTPAPPAVIDAGLPVVIDAGAPAPVPVVKKEEPKKVEPKKEAPKVEEKKEDPETVTVPIDFSILLPPPSPLEKQFYEVSAVYAVRNFGFNEGPMTLSGLRVNERNGGVGKMLVYFATQLLLAAGEASAQANGKYLGSTYGPGYRIDYSRAYTSSEMAAMREAREQAGRDTLASNFSLDFSYYWAQPGISNVNGFSMELTPLTISFDDEQQWGMEIAGVWTRFGDKTVAGADSTMAVKREYNNFGLPVRFMYQGRFFHVTLQYTLNFFGGFGFSPKVAEENYIKSLGTSAIQYNNSPLMLAISFTPIRHFFIRGTGYWEKFAFNLNVLSYQLEAGFRF